MASLTLNNDEIHLWQCRPQEINTAELLARYQALLTDDEKQKQQRYRFAKDRHDALITRAFIRDCLSHYADIDAHQWRFEKGEKDKPEILNPPLPLRFNISHTENLIICAIMLKEDIGCDVENISRNNDVMNIAERYFSSTETRELFSLPKEQQRSRFFDYWTLKESYIKAWGLGLAIPLGDFSFHIQPGKDRHVNSAIHLSFAPHRIDYPEIWRHWLFYPSEEHRIALSVRSQTNNQKRDYKLRYFTSIPLLEMAEIKSLSSLNGS